MGFSPWRGAELTADQYSALTAPGTLSDVAYDGSNRVTNCTIDGVSYTITYAADLITISGSDGTIREVALDGSGRIEAAQLTSA